MTITVEIEGLDELQRDWGATVDELESDLRDASREAATAGVQEAQNNHPYTDRTYQLTETAHVEPYKDVDGAGVADMVWSKDYASFVDKGTSRSGPYPFTPQASERAESSLERGAEVAVAKAADRMNR